MKKILIWFTLLFLIGFTSAITIEKEAFTNVIVPQFNQPAEISLLISNTTAGSYNVYTLTDVHLVPTEHFNLGSGENKVDVQIFPMQSLSTRGFYTFIYYLRDSDGVNNEDRMTVKVVDIDDLIDLSSNSNYPGPQMTFYVKNKENAKLTGLTAKFSSIFFETQESFDLGPFEQKEFIVTIDQEKVKKIPAGSYLLEADFETDRGEGIVKGKIYFGEKKGIESETTHDGFLIRTETITKTNSGNTLETIRVEASRNILSSTLTFFSESPTGVERKGLVNNYYWIKPLGPSEVLEIKVRTNYLIFLLILVIIAGTFFAFKRFNSTKLQLTKSVSHVRTKGGEFALRVRLHLKATKDLENVSVIEKVPAIVKVHENFGVLKPSSINLKERRLQWDLGNLKAGDERMFSYVIYSTVGVVGKFSLPEAAVVFEENGDLLESFSNKVFFLSEQVQDVD